VTCKGGSTSPELRNVQRRSVVRMRLVSGPSHEQPSASVFDCRTKPTDGAGDQGEPTQVLDGVLTDRLRPQPNRTRRRSPRAACRAERLSIRIISMRSRGTAHLREHGLVIPVWRIHRAIGIGSDRVVEMLAGERIERELGEKVSAAQGPLYEEMIDEVEPMDGAYDLLHDLKSAGHSLILASSATGKEAEHYTCIGVLTGGFSEEELHEAGAVVVFDSVAHLRHHLSHAR
jgi:phosphoglycolate phosphatase-like HAD superfamily hydrolase